MKDEPFSDLGDEPERWSKMLQAVSNVDRLWEPAELSAVWAHELTAPVEFEALESGVDSTTDSEFAPSVDPDSKTDVAKAIRTYGELFQHPSPPLNLLKKTKEFAKRNRHRTGSLLPPEICAVLYLAAIVAAQVRWNTRISRISDSKLRDGLEWALAQDWLDERTKALLRKGLVATTGFA